MSQDYDRVLRQLAEVRASCEANMLSMREVQWAANRLGLYALVMFAEECQADRRGGSERWVAALSDMSEEGES